MVNRPTLTAFVREVVLPGSRGTIPRIDPQYCRFNLKYGPSRIHRWGVFAAESIPASRRVMEYTGQRINHWEVYRRRVREHLYIFWLNEHWALDGGIGGSGAEFINHSCEPNLRAVVRNKRIFLASSRRIARGEELTLDYHLQNEYRLEKCLCGAARCRGTLSPPFDSP